MPVVSTMNSFDGRIKADAVIVGSGAGGGVSFFATDTTDVVVDITGYFVNPSVAGGLVFVPISPLQYGRYNADQIRTSTGLYGPSLTAFTARSFPVSTVTLRYGITRRGLLAEYYGYPKDHFGLPDRLELRFCATCRIDAERPHWDCDIQCGSDRGRIGQCFCIIRPTTSI